MNILLYIREYISIHKEIGVRICCTDFYNNYFEFLHPEIGFLKPDPNFDLDNNRFNIVFPLVAPKKLLLRAK